MDDALERFAGARAWAERHGMPRHVFVKTSGEIKPMYVDFESPVATEILSHHIRRAERLTVSEMVPHPDSAWLTGPDGKRYTSELPFFALDPLRL